MSYDPKNLPEVTLDFSRYMNDTIQREAAKQNVVLPKPGQGNNSQQPYNPNREYQLRYSHRIADRMWIGNRRY